MAKYVDGFLIPIPKRNTAVYRQMAREGRKAWMKFGALDYKECILDDAKPSFVTFTFAKAARVKPKEAVWFSFIVFRSKKHRNAVNKKVHTYFAKKYGENAMQEMPFNAKRFAYGGFRVVVDSK